MPVQNETQRFVNRAPHDITVRAVRFEQGTDDEEQTLYATAIPMSELKLCWGVDIWSESQPEDERGYQRKPLPSRVRQVADYVARPDALLPIGGLANNRERSLRWEPDGIWDGRGPQSGLLTIPKDSTLWIVDAQHRILGLSQAIEEGFERLDDFVIPLTIAVGMDQREEAKQFELINTNQKRVETALARRLLAARGEENWEARGADVAGILNTRPSVWRDHIISPNETRRTKPHGWAKETSFVTSLKPILQLPAFRSSAVSTETIAKAIDRYWEAIESAWPEAFTSGRSADFLIHRTPGLFSLHGLFPLVWEYARQEVRGGDAPDRVLEIYRRVFADLAERLGPDFWLSAKALREAERDGMTASSFGTGMAAFKQLQEHLERSLDIRLEL